jgi:beta-lactamase class A
MRRQRFGRVAVVLALLFGAGAHAADADWAGRLGPAVREAAEGLPGELSVYVQDVATGAEYGFRADDVTYLSSTIKVVVALEVLRQVDAGELRLDDARTFTAADLRDGVGPLGPSELGRTFTVEELLALMLVQSDNSAADKLIRLVGAENVASHPASRGVQLGRLEPLLDERLQLYRKLTPAAGELTPEQVRFLGRYGTLTSRARALTELLRRTPAWTAGDLEVAFDEFYAERINSGSMRAFGQLLGQIARCEGLSAESCARLQGWMKACRTGRQRIRAGLPPEIAWAHKTGTQHRRACDVGILWLRPERPVVVATCARGFQRVGQAEATFARIGRAVWSAFEVGEGVDALEATDSPEKTAAGEPRLGAPR